MPPLTKGGLDIESTLAGSGSPPAATLASIGISSFVSSVALGSLVLADLDRSDLDDFVSSSFFLSLDLDDFASSSFFFSFDFDDALSDFLSLSFDFESLDLS